jgi:hypothetical protein
VSQINPTKRAYGDLNSAYDFFNRHLFGGALPRCLITMQRTNKAYGYFAGDRFGALDGGEIADEIALNPSHFASRGTERVLSTLVHEMVHLWQHHRGSPSRNAYHNKEWAAKMREVGLVPSSTGKPGGKETGNRCLTTSRPAALLLGLARGSRGEASPYHTLSGGEMRPPARSRLPARADLLARVAKRKRGVNPRFILYAATVERPWYCTREAKPATPHESQLA